MAFIITAVCFGLAMLLISSESYVETTGVWLTNFVAETEYSSTAVTTFIQHNLVYHVIAVVYVFVIYRFRFAEWGAQTEKPAGYPPRPARHFTSWLRFEIWAALYAGTGIIVLYLIYHYPQLLNFLQDIQAQTAGGAPDGDAAAAASRIQEELAGGTSPATPYSQRLTLGVATAVGLAFLPKVEPALRAAFQRAALIPANAQILVNVIRDRFDRFRPVDAEVRTFLVEHNARRLPYLYREEFRADLVNQSFLEVYPRMEFIRWKFKLLNNDRRFKNVFDEYRQDLTDLDVAFANLRANILELGDSLQKFFGPQREPEVAAVHARHGIAREAGGAIAITLFDDVVAQTGPKTRAATAEAAGLAEAAATFDALPKDVQQLLVDRDEEIRKDLQNRLKLVCDEAHRIYERLIQVTVFAALGSKVLNPRHALREFGLEVEAADRVAFDWHRFLGVSAAMLVTLFCGVLAYFWAGGIGGSSALDAGGNAVLLWTLSGLSLLLGGLAGGYAVGLFILNNKLAKHEGAGKIRFSNVDLALATVTGWSTSVIAFALAGLVLGLGSLAPTGWIWGFVPAVFGATAALAAHRIKAGRETWPVGYIVRLCAVTVAAALLTLLFRVRFDPNALLADVDFAVFVVLTNAVCAVWFGSLLRGWHREGVDA